MEGKRRLRRANSCCSEKALCSGVALPCLPPPIAKAPAFECGAPLKAAVRRGGGGGVCSSPPLRCFSSLIQISICVCVSPEDRRCATYQEILSRYANVPSREGERGREKGGESGMIGGRGGDLGGTGEGGGTVLGWMFCRGAGPSFASGLRAGAPHLRDPSGHCVIACLSPLNARVTVAGGSSPVPVMPVFYLWPPRRSFLFGGALPPSRCKSNLFLRPNLFLCVHE